MDQYGKHRFRIDDLHAEVEDCERDIKHGKDLIRQIVLQDGDVTMEAINLASSVQRLERTKALLKMAQKNMDDYEMQSIERLVARQRCFSNIAITS